MAFTYDTTIGTDLAKVRLLIPDNQQSSYVFEDAEITAFLALEGDDVLRATAMALETIGSSEALTQKVLKIQDVETDGAALLDSLRMRAADLRARSAEGEAGTANFDWAQPAGTDWNKRLLVQNQRLTS